MIITKAVLGVASLFISISFISTSQSHNNNNSINNENDISTSLSDIQLSNLSDSASSLHTIPLTISTLSMTTSKFVEDTTQTSTMTTTPKVEMTETSTSHTFNNVSAVTNSSSASSAFDNETTTITLSVFNAPSNTSYVTTSTTVVQNPASTDDFQVPVDCSAYKLLDDQPSRTKFSSIKKCCPPHQTFIYDYGKRECANTTNVNFNMKAIYARFYENCIEDEELNVNISVITENNCKNGLIYNKNYGDLLYVIQNGSLLRIDEKFESYDVFDHYCLEMDSQEGVITAIVCEFDDLLLHVGRTQALIFATCMLISVPCLILTASLYLIVEELRDLHGKSLACHSISLAIGFFLLAFTQFRDMNTFEGYFIQFCIIACFLWLTVMWIDICAHAWYYLPKGVKQTTKDDNIHLMYYSLFTFGISLILVILTYKNKLSGLPSYYIKGTTKVARTSQMFFIPPITVSLIANFLLYISAYFGFKKLQKMNISQFLAFKLEECAISNKCTKSQREHMRKVETIMKSTAYLTAIMTFNWIFEIISFYTESSSLIFDIINALQGVFIFAVFVCTPRPWQIIKRWWNDRGSFTVSDANGYHQPIEMTPLNIQKT